MCPCVCLLCVCVYVCAYVCVYMCGTGIVDKMGLLYATDGVRAFANRAVSYTPTEYKILSLAPNERHKAKNMVLQMIHPTHMTTKQLQKYYDFAVQHELVSLYKEGLPGTQIKYVACPHHSVHD